MLSQGSNAAINGRNFEKIVRKELKELFNTTDDENITENKLLKDNKNGILIIQKCLMMLKGN